MFCKYKNGNYIVCIDNIDGTKIRYTQDDKFTPEYPESMDIKITNQCDMGCLFCHEDSKPDGKHCDIDQEFINTIKPFQEIAVGGGNVLSHPQLEEFLKKIIDKQGFPSITVNQKHFMQYFDKIKELKNNKLVYGVGVSLTDSSNKEFIDKVKDIPNTVLHAINGIFNKDDLNNLKGKDLKILFLGYKEIRRGKDYLNKENNKIENNKKWLRENIKEVYKAFNIVSFDNLACEQLNIKDTVNEETWKTRYMGDDGNFTFYIDMVERQFSMSSTSLDRKNIENKSIKEMFDYIRNR